MPERHNILANAELLGQLDFVNAKAQLAKALEATEPLINLENHVELKQARHPLIDQLKSLLMTSRLGRIISHRCYGSQYRWENHYVENLRLSPSDGPIWLIYHCA